jgi:hypothetical protein
MFTLPQDGQDALIVFQEFSPPRLNDLLGPPRLQTVDCSKRSLASLTPHRSCHLRRDGKIQVLLEPLRLEQGEESGVSPVIRKNA